MRNQRWGLVHVLEHTRTRSHLFIYLFYASARTHAPKRCPSTRPARRLRTAIFRPPALTDTGSDGPGEHLSCETSVEGGCAYYITHTLKKTKLTCTHMHMHMHTHTHSFTTTCARSSTWAVRRVGAPVGGRRTRTGAAAMGGGGRDSSARRAGSMGTPSSSSPPATGTRAWWRRSSAARQTSRPRIT